MGRIIDMGFGLSISTYFGDHTLDTRIDTFKKSINSLHETNFNGDVFIVDDGSTSNEHLDYIRSLNDARFNIIKKHTNSGISACKNTGIKHIINSGHSIGFLADDDLIYKDGWDKIYINAIKITGIQHFCLWVEDLNKKQNINYNGFEICKTPHVNGAFLTFTKNIIDSIGYFKILPYVYGHEHSNFTLRCLNKKYMPFFCDVANSNEYIKLIPNTSKSSLGGPEMVSKDKMLENLRIAMSSRSYERCVE